MDLDQQVSNMIGKKFDQDKEPLEILPPSYWSVNYFTLRVDSFLLSKWYFYENDFPEFIKDFDGYHALEHGLSKYGLHNWITGMRWGRIVGAFHRHYNKYDDVLQKWVPRDLNDIDKDSGLRHGEHANACLIMLKEYYSAYKYRKLAIGEIDCPFYTHKQYWKERLE